MLAYFIRGFLLGFPNAAVPGPFQAYLLVQTMKNGIRPTLLVALAPLISDGPIILLVLIILSQLSDSALGLIQLAGAVFILHLSYGAYQTMQKPLTSCSPCRSATYTNVAAVFKGSF